jgi:hypothetical protein
MAAMVTRGKDMLTKAVELTREPLLANAGYLTGISLVGSVVGFVFWGLAARLYQPEDVGVASAVLSAVALVSGVAGLGMGTGLVRFLPKVRSPRRLLNTALTCSIGTAFLTSGVFLAGLSVWSPSLVALWWNANDKLSGRTDLILVTIGMHDAPFDRLVRAADEMASRIEESVVIQRGVSRYMATFSKCFDFANEG